MLITHWSGISGLLGEIKYAVRIDFSFFVSTFRCEMMSTALIFRLDGAGQDTFLSTLRSPGRQ